MRIRPGGHRVLLAQLAQPRADGLARHADPRGQLLLGQRHVQLQAVGRGDAVARAQLEQVAGKPGEGVLRPGVDQAAVGLAVAACEQLQHREHRVRRWPRKPTNRWPGTTSDVSASSAVTVAMRGAGSNAASSPRVSPGPRNASSTDGLRRLARAAVVTGFSRLVGTLVAGVIAATLGNGVGGVGVALQASILPVRVLDSGGTGSSEHGAEVIRWATRNGADIINLSLADAPGLVGGNGGIIGSDVETAIAEAHAAGVVVVAASGNEGRTSTPYAPETPVIVVGASNRQNQLWAHSNRDARTLFAPGVEIISTYIQGGYARRRHVVRRAGRFGWGGDPAQRRSHPPAGARPAVRHRPARAR